MRRFAAGAALCSGTRRLGLRPEAEKPMLPNIWVVPVVQVHEVVSFYHLFHREKKGKCHFSLCQTTACALRGSEDIIKHIEDRLKIKPGETTPDGKFTLGDG